MYVDALLAANAGLFLVFAVLKVEIFIVCRLADGSGGDKGGELP